MSIDVVILTKNSADTIKNCLYSLLQLPINNLIVIDGQSTDDTIEQVKGFARRFGLYLSLVYHSGTRAECRQLGICSVTTPWFMFLDSDVELFPSWLDEAKNYMADPNTGAIDGYEIPLLDWLQDYRMALQKLATRTGKQHSRANSAFTGNCLIRTLAVKGIEIPSDLHHCEDTYIRKHIESQYYKWIVTEHPVSLHHMKPYRSSQLIESNKLATRHKFLTAKQLIKNTLTCIPKAVYASLITHNARILYEVPRQQGLAILGYLGEKTSL